MIFILLAIFVPLILLFVGLVLGAVAGSEDKQVGTGAIAGAVIGLVLSIVFVGGLTIGSSMHQVAAGHVGLVYTFDDITGQRDSGFQLTWPWQGFKVVSVQTQKIRPETTCGEGQTINQVVGVDDNGFDITEQIVIPATPECLEAFSEETQDVFIVPTINLKVSSIDVQRLFIDIGPDYIDKLVRPRMHQIFKDETVKFTSTDLAPNRELIRASVLARLTAELAPFSITVEDLLVDNIDFRQEFKDAIETKQVAEQEAQRQEELIRAAKAQAQQRIAVAQGEATANELISASLEVRGELVLQQKAIEALAESHVEIIVLPADNSVLPLLNLGQGGGLTGP